MIFALVGGIFAQNATDMTDDMNAQVQALDQAAVDQRNADAQAQFEEDMRKAVLDHQTSIKHVQVGAFNMLVQENCVYEPPKKPEYETVTERDCFKAVFNATTTAELVAKATPLNPPSIKMVMNAVNSCELQVNWIKEFEIYNACWEGEVPAEYMKIIGPIEEDLKEKGYERVENKWVKRGTGAVINLEESQNRVD